MEQGSQGFVINILTDMYSHRLDAEINRLLKKKEKLKEFSSDSFFLQPAQDWKGSPIFKVIEGHEC